jgi:hypothetical protein
VGQLCYLRELEAWRRLVLEAWQQLVLVVWGRTVWEVEAWQLEGQQQEAACWLGVSKIHPRHHLDNVWECCEMVVALASRCRI